MLHKTLCFIFVLFIASSAFSLQDVPSSIDIELKSVRIYTFKNGVGLVVAEVELPQPSGHYRLRPLVQATQGSFWISWPGNIALTGVKATQVQTSTLVSAANMPEILEANIGREIDLKIKDIWQRVKIVDFPERHDDPIIRPLQENVIPPPPPKGRGDLLLIQDGLGVRAVPRSLVQEVRFCTDEPHYTLERPQMENAIEFTAESAENSSGRSGPATVTLFYLGNGIAWTPSYVVDITQDDKAAFSAKAVIVNDLVPLENAEMELIAGFPHIAFSNVNSSFSLTPLQQILNQLRDDRSERRNERALMISNTIQQVPLYDARSPAVPSMPSTPIMGESSEDLFFYLLKNISLKKGERGYYPLFAGEIPYEHLYTWTIPDYMDANDNYRRDRAEVPQVIWHALRLTNATANPWTTAAAMTMKNGRILGQDMIQFTPPKASTELKITHAVSFHAEQNEYEIERRRNASEFYGRRYDLVTVEGELALTNFNDRTISVEITKHLSGEVKNAEGKPKIVKLARGLRRVNPQSQLVWNVKVQPGKKNSLKLKYTCQVYVRD